jgi:heme-degrading monooxygenase HmoA
MYTAGFIWEPGVYDAEFHRLNETIENAAKSLPGFLGVESWQAADGARRNATYYWENIDTLQAFAEHHVHRDAKRQYSRWYRGCHVVVSQVLRAYGDGAFAHITSDGPGRLA